MKKVKDNPRGIDKFIELASFPPITTGQFNKDGTTEFTSRLQPLIFLPSICFIIFVTIVLLARVIYGEVLESSLQTVLLDYGFDMAYNNTDEKLTQNGIVKPIFDVKNFLESFEVQINHTNPEEFFSLFDCKFWNGTFKLKQGIVNDDGKIQI